MASRALPDGVRWLIAAACGVTFLVALSGLQSIWDVTPPADLSPFLVRDLVPIAFLLIVSAAYLPPWRLPRLMRVAVLLPFIQLAMLIIVAQLWQTLRADLDTWSLVTGQVHVQTPPLRFVAIVVVLLVLTAIAIKRRHGEWAHAMVTLSLSNLLLIGLWLPVVSWGAGIDTHIGWQRLEQVTANPVPFVCTVVVPPWVCAVVFTTIAYRLPHVLAKLRPAISIALKAVFGLALVLQLSGTDSAALLYLEHSYLVLLAVVLAIIALANLIAISWLRSWRLYRKLRTLTTHTGVVTGDHGDVASFEATSWLRGPRLVTSAFAVTSERGEIPVTGAAMLAHLPATTTGLAIGERAGVLAAGNRVVVATRTEASSGHPFRAMEVTDVELVAPIGTTAYRFVDLALVAWRPAVAYLAILIAVALPGLAILLT